MPRTLPQNVKRRVVRAGLVAAAQLELWPRINRLIPNSLSVLLYHRIGDPLAADFFGLTNNVSATHRGFAEQLDYLQRYYTVVGLQDCIAWATTNAPLPRNAVLITFDDGYADSLTTALPELAQRWMRAILFIATAYVGGARVYFWDWVAEAFHRTEVTTADLPLLGARQWRNGTEQRGVAIQW